MRYQRLFALLLAVLMLLFLFGCSSSEEGGENSESRPEGEAMVQTVFQSSRDEILFSNDACSVRLVEDGIDEWGDYCWTLELKNMTNSELLITVDDVYVNEISADPYWAELLASGERMTTSLSWFASLFDDCDIDTVERVDLRLSAYPQGKPENLVADIELTVYPGGLEGYTAQSRQWKSTDTVLADNALCALAVVSVEEDSLYGSVEGFDLNLYLENRSEADVTFTLENVRVNGQSNEPYWYRELAAGKKYFTNVTWVDSELAQMEIVQVLNIQFDLVMTDSETGAELYRETLSFDP